MKQSAGKTIAKNASFLMGSQLVTWALSLALTIFLPRYLGAEGMGQIHLAQSLWMIGSIFVTFGMNMLIIKEVARDPEKISKLFSNSIILRILLYVLGFAGMMLYVRAAGYDAQTVTVIYIIGGGFFFAQFMQTCRASLEGLEQMGSTSIGDIMTRTFNTVVSIIALLLGANVITIAIINVVTMIVHAALFMRPLFRQGAISFSADFALMKWMMVAGVPYFLSSFFAVAYRQMDVVVISLFIDNAEAVGWYGSADKLFGTMMFVPTVFITAIFPALSRMFEDDDKTQIATLISRGFNMLLLIGIPIGLGVFAIAEPLVLLLFGEEFRNSAPILAIFGIVLILTYQTILLGRYLISIDKQQVWTTIMIVAAVTAIPLDLFLIPWCEQQFGNAAIGGALAYIFTEGGMLIAGLWVLPKGYITRQNAFVALKAILAGGIMATAVWMLRDQFILIPIIAGAIIYPSLVLAFRAVPKDELDLLLGFARSLIAKIRSR